MCGGHFKQKKGPGAQARQYSCSDNQIDLEEIFGIKVTEDSPTVHPPSYCNRCQNIIYFTRKASREGSIYKPRKLEVAAWCEHGEGVCSVCEDHSSHKVGGRPKKRVYAPGRPKRGSVQSVVRHIKTIAPPTFCQHRGAISENDFFNCPICLQLIERPKPRLHEALNPGWNPG